MLSADRLQSGARSASLTTNFQRESFPAAEKRCYRSSSLSRCLAAHQFKKTRQNCRINVEGLPRWGERVAIR